VGASAVGAPAVGRSEQAERAEASQPLARAARARLTSDDLDETRRETRRKSLWHPLQHLATDFRDRVRRGLLARGHSLRPAHQGVIVHLGSSGTRLTELARRAGSTKQAMGKLVDELEAIGYVERVPDPGDGRAKLVRFSPRGRALLRDAGEIVDEIWASYAEAIGEARLHGLRETLGLLLRHMEAPSGRRSEEAPT
jgi:DNA-binding MarR family transcriptional regulator